MNDLLSLKKIGDLPDLLGRLQRQGFTLRDMIDGGAGAGHVSQQLLRYGTHKSSCFAFEPFPGNHKFFDGKDSRIKLVRAALGADNRQVDFAVPSVVDADSEWGRRGMAGYSSVGFIGTGNPDDTVLRVDCVRADDAIPDSANVDFVKLDLQGGELDALRGMASLLESVAFMWIEFTGDRQLLEFLIAQGYHLFDTEYFFLGDPTPEVHAGFAVTKENVILSTGQTAYFAFKKAGWVDYFVEFMELRAKDRLVQTDIVCVRSEFMDLFHKAVVS